MDKGTVIYEYKFPPEFRPAYVNGAYGGIGPQGEFMINFFLEQIELPVADTFELRNLGPGRAELGAQILPKTDESKKTLQRVIQTGVLMNLDCAKRIHTFLGNTIKAYEEATRGTK